MTPDTIVFVNDSISPFTAEMLRDKKKRLETRSRNTLAPYTDRRVYIARTGKGKTVLVGSCIFSPGTRVDKTFWDGMRDMHRVPAGCRYDLSESDGTRWVYPVVAPEWFDEPLPMPENIVRHGRIAATIID